MCPIAQQTGVVGPVSIDNLIVLAAAMIGVGGSYFIFCRRLTVHEEKLRTAIVSEIAVMAADVHFNARILEAETIDQNVDLYIPLDPIANDVFTENTGDLGLLEEAEVEQLTTAYSRAASVRRQITALQDTDSPAVPDVRKLRSDLITLNNELIDSLEILNENREENWEVTEEITKLQVPDYNPSPDIDSESANQTFAQYNRWI